MGNEEILTEHRVDTVLIVDEGGSARKILKNSKAPVRTVVAGIVDKVYLGKEG